MNNLLTCLCMLPCLVLLVESGKPSFLIALEAITRDSVPLTLCEDHPAFDEEPELFVECSKGRQCFFVARDVSLTMFGTFCKLELFNKSKEHGSGSGDEDKVDYVSKSLKKIFIGGED